MNDLAYWKKLVDMYEAGKVRLNSKGLAILWANSRMKEQAQKIKELENKDRSGFCIFCGTVVYCRKQGEELTDEQIDEYIRIFQEHELKCEKNPLVSRINELEERIREPECIYCEEKIRDAEEYLNHWKTCDKHPARAKIDELKEWRKGAEICIGGLENRIKELEGQLCTTGEALKFYAKRETYLGPNQRAEYGEENLGGYRIDAQRDYGAKARAALSSPTPCAHEAEAKRLREASPVDIRNMGWTVACHNDYRLNGKKYTFWLFTNDDRAVSGEGETDAEALNNIRAELRRLAGGKVKNEGL